MIKSNSDHVLRVDSAAVKLATMVMANSSGNLILSACKRNSLCTCSDNENHSLNLIKKQQTNLSFCEESEFGSKSNCTEHTNGENKKCKLDESSSDNVERSADNAASGDHNQVNMCSNNQQSNQQSNQNNQRAQSNSNNDDDDRAARHEQNNEIDNRPQANDDDQENNNDELNRNLFQMMPNQMVDINNNIIEPELMLVDENNNLIGLPDANFDLNNNYIWNNNNLDQQQRRAAPDNQPNDRQQSNQQQNQQQQHQSSNSNERTSQQHLSLLKEKLNCTKINCTTNCKSTPTVCAQSVQIRQRKKLLELDLNKPRTGGQFYSAMNDDENVIREEESGGGPAHSNHYVFKRSASSGRRKKSIQCKKCLTKHLTKCDHGKCEHSRCEFKNEYSKCEHNHSMDCSTPEGESKKIHHNFKTKASTPITLCPVSTPTIKEQLVTGDSPIDGDVKQSKSTSSNLIEQQTAVSLISPQCPICLSLTQQPCKPNNCSHVFCEICVQEWAKVMCGLINDVYRFTILS